MALTSENSDGLGQALKSARARAGLTREEVAKAAGITATSVYRIETGRRVPTIDSLAAMSKALDIHVEIHAGRVWVN